MLRGLTDIIAPGNLADIDLLQFCLQLPMLCILIILFEGKLRGLNAVLNKH